MSDDKPIPLSRRATLNAFALAVPGVTVTDALAEGEASQSGAPDSCAHQRDVERAYIKGKFGQVHFRRVGSPGRQRPLVLLHPSPLSSYVFEVFMPHMSRDRAVFAIDTPGYGMSDPPSSPPEIGDYADAMLDFIARQNLKQVDVMGYHTGSAIAVEMATKAPAVVKHVVMIGAALFPEDELQIFRRQTGPRSPDDVPAALTKRWPTFKNRDWRMVCSAPRAMNILLDVFRNVDVAHWGFGAANNHPLAQRLGALKHPTLVLNPEDDLWEYTPKAAALLQNGRVHNLPGWTHGFLDIKAPEVALLVREFLAT